MSALPAAWASRDGWTPRAPADTRPLSVRRLEKSRVAYEALKAAPAAAGDSRGEATGLVFFKNGTSETATIGAADRIIENMDAYDAAVTALGSDVVTVVAAEGRLRRMARSVRFSAKAHARLTDQPSAMFTLTHRPGETPDARDVSKFIDCVRKWAGRKLGMKSLRYVWVAENQAGRAKAGDHGSVHYHVAVWLTPELRRKGAALEAKNPKFKASGVLPKPDAKGWWKKGSTERNWVQKSVVSYLAKYLSKGGEGSFPKGLRLHGAGGFNPEQRLTKTHHMFPSWLRKDTTPAQRWHRITGGWESRETGARAASPWECLLQGPTVKLVRRTPENYALVQAAFEASRNLMCLHMGVAPCN